MIPGDVMAIAGPAASLNASSAVWLLWRNLAVDAHDGFTQAL